jgi:hypothetical protein
MQRLARLVLVSAVLVLSACTQSASSEPSIALETVRATWELSYGTDGPPVSLELGALQPGTDGWAEQEVEIHGAQIEYVVDVQLTDTYRPERSTLIGTDTSDETTVRLMHGDTVSIFITIPNELPSGTHTFDLVLPVWINASEVIPDHPDDEITITLRYTVQTLEEQKAVEGFCKGAVPMTDGRTPSLDELNDLSHLAETELDNEDYETFAGPLAELIEDLDAYLSGTGHGYSTIEVNEVIGRICNVNMLSEDVIGD